MFLVYIKIWAYYLQPAWQLKVVYDQNTHLNWQSMMEHQEFFWDCEWKINNRHAHPAKVFIIFTSWELCRCAKFSCGFFSSSISIFVKESCKSTISSLHSPFLNMTLLRVLCWAQRMWDLLPFALKNSREICKNAIKEGFVIVDGRGSWPYVPRLIKERMFEFGMMKNQYFIP